MSKWALGTFSSTLWMVMAVSCLIVAFTQPASAPDWVVRAWALGGFLSGQAGFLVMLLTPEEEKK